MRQSKSKSARRNAGQDEIDQAARRLIHDPSESIVFFTGAGVSRAFGYPLTRDLLPRMLEWRDDTDFLQVPGDSRDLPARRRRTLKSVIKHLLPGVRKGNESLPLITSLLSIVDHAIARRQPLWPTKTIKSLRAAREILDHAIFDTLEEYRPFQKDDERRLQDFASMLRALQKRRKNRRVGIVTSNYDMSSDWAVLAAASSSGKNKKRKLGPWKLSEIRRIDFGTEWLDAETGGTRRNLRPDDARFFCYKLHGSTNWLRCPSCQQIYINQSGGTWFQAFRADRDDNNTCHCSTRLEPQIVSPSFVRRMDDLNLLNIWSHAQHLLRRANHWVIMGYSLPEEDIAIRSLLIRAMQSRPGPLKVTVVQQSDRAKPNYAAIFGKTNMIFVSDGVEAFVNACARVARR